MQSDDIYKENKKKKKENITFNDCVFVCLFWGPIPPLSKSHAIYLVNALPNLTPAVELRKKKTKPVFPRTSIVYSNVDAYATGAC